MCNGDNSGGEDNEWQTVKSKRAKSRENKKSKYEPQAQTDLHNTNSTAYRQEAIQWIKDNKESIKDKVAGENDSRTVCYMFYVVSGHLRYRYGVSGGATGQQESLRALRDLHNVDRRKETICAEEHVLLLNPGIDYLFSISYSQDFGFKRACTNCASILNLRHIEDLQTKHISRDGT